MTEKVSAAWTERQWGVDRVLTRQSGDAVMAFALGPADGIGGHRRMSRLITGPAPAAVRWCRQVHGAAVARVGAEPPGALEIGDGDGLVTTAPGVGLVVWTADCVPILLVLDHAAAAVHAGWRGCAADIVKAALDALIESTGGPPGRLRAALGPSVCGICYEVGPEVGAALDALGVERARWWSDNRVDLRGFLTARLEVLGVPADRIETVGGCTFESPTLASFRRDGADAGRQWSMVFLDD